MTNNSFDLVVKLCNIFNFIVKLCYLFNFVEIHCLKKSNGSARCSGQKSPDGAGRLSVSRPKWTKKDQNQFHLGRRVGDALMNMYHFESFYTCMTKSKWIALSRGGYGMRCCSGDSRGCARWTSTRKLCAAYGALVIDKIYLDSPGWARRSSGQKFSPQPWVGADGENTPSTH